MTKAPTWLQQIHWHQWTPWSDPIVTHSGNKQQWRVCTHCNKAQFRTLAWDKQAAVADVTRAVNEARAKEAAK